MMSPEEAQLQRLLREHMENEGRLANELLGTRAALEVAEAKLAAGLQVADDLDGDPEWAARQIRTALTDGIVTNGAPYNEFG